MESYLIRGGRTLSGSVRVHGAKNSVLPILAAALLCRGTCVIHNCPALSDVDASIAILRHLGCQVAREGDAVTVNAAVLTRQDIPRPADAGNALIGHLSWGDPGPHRRRGREHAWRL